MTKKTLNEGQQPPVSMVKPQGSPGTATYGQQPPKAMLPQSPPPPQKNNSK